MTYTMLPVRLREALFGGLLLSIVHVYFSLSNSQLINWLQVKFAWSRFVWRCTGMLVGCDRRMWGETMLIVVK